MNFKKYFETVGKMLRRFGKESKVFKDFEANHQLNVRKATRPCLQCKKKKVHNNSFCSVKCCNNYTIMQRTIRKNIRNHARDMKLRRHRASPCYDGSR